MTSGRTSYGVLSPFQPNFSHILVNSTADNNAKGNPAQSAKKMQSQQAKQVSSARRKMGS